MTVQQLSLFDELPARQDPTELLREIKPDHSLKTLLVAGESWSYRLKRSARKTIGLYVDDEGLLVIAPRWVRLGDIEEAIRERREWIVRKSTEMAERQRQIAAKRIEWCEGGVVPFLGQSITLRVRDDVASPVFHADESELHLPQVRDANSTRMREQVQGWFQRQALRIFHERVDHYAQVLRVKVKKIALSSSNSRWGTASADGSIRLNWRLLHFPVPVIDYVVAHEVAHLREMNHSPRFWHLVESVYPEHKSARAYLRNEVLASF